MVQTIIIIRFNLRGFRRTDATNIRRSFFEYKHNNTIIHWPKSPFFRRETCVMRISRKPQSWLDNVCFLPTDNFLSPPHRLDTINTQTTLMGYHKKGKLDSKKKKQITHFSLYNIIRLSVAVFFLCSVISTQNKSVKSPLIMSIWRRVKKVCTKPAESQSAQAKININRLHFRDRKLESIASAFCFLRTH